VKNLGFLISFNNHEQEKQRKKLDECKLEKKNICDNNCC